MDDGTVVDTERATACYEENRDWEGETLYRSSKGRWYLVTGGNRPSARYLTTAQAAAWLILNEHPVPDELRAEVEKLVE